MRISKTLQFAMLALLLVGTAAQAQVDCSSAFGMPIGILYTGAGMGSAGGSAIPGTPFCGGLGVANAVDIFSLSLSATAMFTVDLTTTGSGVLGLGIFSACDENACLASVAPVGTAAQLSICLPAGNYYVVMNDMTDLFYTYYLSGELTACDDPVVGVEGDSWGSLKALYR